MKNKEGINNHLRIMSTLGVQASEAGRALRNALLSCNEFGTAMMKVVEITKTNPKLIHAEVGDEQYRDRGIRIEKIFIDEIEDFAREDNRAPENQSYKPKYKFHR